MAGSGNLVSQLWSANVAPLVTAARAGASKAASTAGRERARARRGSWWRQRWLVVTAAGLAVAGAAAGTYAVVAKRRSTAEQGETDEATTPGEVGEPGEAGAEPTGGIRSTVETSREKVAGAARTVIHKFRNGAGDEAAPAPPPLVASTPNESSSG